MDVIAAVMGIPEADRTALRHHADQILIRHDGEMRIPDEAIEGMFGLLGYFIEDLPERKQGIGEGLISDLIDVEVDGRRLSDEELLGFCVLFVIAGHETTTKMVANTVELLSRHPDQRAGTGGRSRPRARRGGGGAAVPQLDAVHASHDDLRPRLSRADAAGGRLGAVAHRRRQP